LSPYLLVKDLSAGDQYFFSLNSLNNIETFLIKKLDQNRVETLYEIKNINDSFVVSVKKPEILEKKETIRLLVTSTLYDTFNQLPYGNELLQRLIEVFAWQNLVKEIADDDSIEILVSKKFALGEFIGYGKIHSVYYHQQLKTRFATFFSSIDGMIRGFFDDNGKSLEKEFAYSPVIETTATSNQQSRFHPIRKKRIRHNGIDYRGPIGTEFFSIADGSVIEKRFDKNVGNMIRIKHKHGVYSEYFHANNLENLAVGQKVKRGQKLGSIGRTGRLCTGPHLHMGLYKLKDEKRHYIDLLSLKKTLKSAPDIPAKYQNEFNQHKRESIALLKSEHLLANKINEGDSVVSK
jgi:murein DD-endopeptidase MepM/ murein hydrolase activator NlpD